MYLPFQVGAPYRNCFKVCYENLARFVRFVENLACAEKVEQVMPRFLFFFILFTIVVQHTASSWHCQLEDKDICDNLLCSNLRFADDIALLGRERGRSTISDCAPLAKCISRNPPSAEKKKLRFHRNAIEISFFSRTSSCTTLKPGR